MISSRPADYDLGKMQSGEKLGDVLLPNWATTPEDFIRTHREALVRRGRGGGGDVLWGGGRGEVGGGAVEFEKCMLILT